MRMDLLKIARELAPFRCDNAGYIWAQSAKGGETVFANIRGWGYMTGRGHGALGLAEAEAVALQRQWGEMFAAALNAYAQTNASLKDQEQRDE